MQYNGNGYMGCCLLFDDVTFCRQVYALLKDFRHYPISHIGDLDVSQPL
jgi:hypothetical protein